MDRAYRMQKSGMSFFTIFWKGWDNSLDLATIVVWDSE